MQTLYLLAGGSEDHGFMLRHCKIEEYIKPYNVAVIMPFVAGKYKLLDLPHGELWWTFHSKEMPAVCANMFKLSRRREDTFVMGGSGGATAALKLALKRPELFGAVAAVAPAFIYQKFHDFMKPNDTTPENMRALHEATSYFYGQPFPPEHDSFEILKAAAKMDIKPAMHLSCGNEDKLLKFSIEFYELAKSLGFDPVWESGPGGHDDDYFNVVLKKVIDWLPLQKIDEVRTEGRKL